MASLVPRTTISNGTSLRSSTITLLDSLNTTAGKANTLARLQLAVAVVPPFLLNSASTGCSFARYALLSSYFGGNASREMNGDGKRMLALSTDRGSF
ncbi:unnamed protein product [Tuber melanosporum]|uniref:(Perigord truffle) hypothetical protein n=1 Tax=Tuber melanosporum (strain Mel28) TaxID=656061 RepID=D5G8M2_TUBMM|nr:uncharacterized protein GSTUM_00003007001 [Tuber melanosporum]CAZ80865.1 unnamed protein product [Tuber melanosporum]